MRIAKSLTLIIICLAFVSCAGNKYQTMYGITSWTYMNHVSLQAQYDTATPEEQEWFKKNVNPYMNMLKQAVLAMDAIENDNVIKASGCATKITEIALGIKYDATKLTQAILNKDYNTLLAEALVLKTLIINKISERGK